MKFRSIFMLALVTIVLTSRGSGRQSYAERNYTGIEPVKWKSPTSRRTFRIFDKPEEGRLMITLGLTRSAVQGFGQGVAMGLVDLKTPAKVYREAAAEWLASQGRSCKVKSADLVAEPQYEVRYRCR